MLTIVRVPWSRPPTHVSPLSHDLSNPGPGPSPATPAAALFTRLLTAIHHFTDPSTHSIDWVSVSHSVSLPIEECQNAWAIHRLQNHSQENRPNTAATEPVVIPRVSESQEFPSPDGIGNAIEQALKLNLPSDQTDINGSLSDSESSLSAGE